MVINKCMFCQSDTSKESDAVLNRLYRDMPTARKVSLIFSAYHTGKKLAFAGLKGRFPDATDRQLWNLWVREHLGPELYHRVYGTDEHE